MVKKLFVAVLGSALVVGMALSQGCDNASSLRGERLDGVQSLDVYVDNDTISLLLVGSIGHRTGVRYLKSTDGGKSWSKSVPVPTGGEPPGEIRRGNDAQIAASGKYLIAVWPTAGGKLDWIGPMASAVSSDGGKTWHLGPDPAGHPYKKGQAFIDIAADAQGVFHVVWIDGSTGSQGLHAASSIDDGKHWTTPKTLDPATCECCWTALKSRPNGRLYALYRNINPRDMGLAVSVNDGKTWQQKGPVGAFDWYFKACPHTGGGLVATGDQSDPVLHAVVWTGEKGEVGLHYLTSTNGGVSWELSQRLGSTAARHSDIAALGRGRVAVVWDASNAQGDSAVFAARSRDGGRTWSKPKSLSTVGAEATHPRIVAVDGHYCVFWIQGDGKWRMLRLPG